MGLYGVGESHAPDAFAAVLDPTTDTHLGARRIHKDFTINTISLLKVIRLAYFDKIRYNKINCFCGSEVTF